MNSKNKTTELNPCPFCRNPVVFKQRDCDMLCFYLVYCPACRCETPMFNSEKAAIKDWNSRTKNPNKI